jgi:transcriptional regulator with XRE-family HTH domain
MTLRELAEAAGTSHATLSAYEQGAKTPRIATLQRILAAAGVALELRTSLRADAGADRVAKGQELVEVLHLAAAFPARHAQTLGAPVFGRRA